MTGDDTEAGGDANADDAERGPTDGDVVETGATAARELVLSRYDTDEVRDLDVTVTFEDGVLEVDVYLDAPADGLRDPERVADDAALTARRAVDGLFEGE